jgi:hypothetical protein
MRFTKYEIKRVHNEERHIVDSGITVQPMRLSLRRIEERKKNIDHDIKIRA